MKQSASPSINTQNSFLGMKQSASPQTRHQALLPPPPVHPPTPGDGGADKVFSAFGFLLKITTFEKTAGFQALAQFSDSDTASAAKDALDGRSIPRYGICSRTPTCLI